MEYTFLKEISKIIFQKKTQLFCPSVGWGDANVMKMNLSLWGMKEGCAVA